MKKLVDIIQPIVNIRISRYAHKVERFSRDYYYSNSREGQKLLGMYLKLINLEPKITSSEIAKKHETLCSEILTKLPGIID